MGNSITINWVADAESPSGSGARSVVSQAITAKGVTAEVFWHAMEKATRSRKVVGFEKAYACKELPDGAFLAMSTFPLPGLGDVVMYTTIHIDKTANVATFRSYGSDSALSPSSLVSTSYLRLYSEPLRMEWWTEDVAGRRASEVVALAMLDLLRRMGSKSSAIANCSSPGDESQKSVLSEPVLDGTVKAEGFLEFTRSVLLKEGARALPDGSLIETAKSWFAPTVYRRHAFDESAEVAFMVTQEFGGDASMRPESLRATSFLKAHKKPFRLELWAMQAPGRRSGEDQKEVVAQVVATALKYIA